MKLWWKCLNYRERKSQPFRSPTRYDQGRNTLWHTIIKIPLIQNKEKVLGTVREKANLPTKSETLVEVQH